MPRFTRDVSRINESRAMEKSPAADYRRKRIGATTSLPAAHAPEKRHLRWTTLPAAARQGKAQPWSLSHVAKHFAKHLSVRSKARVFRAPSNFIV